MTAILQHDPRSQLKLGRGGGMRDEPKERLRRRLAHVKLDVQSNSRTAVEYSTGRVENAAEVAFNSDLSNLLD